MQAKFVTVNGLRSRYLRAGSGDAVILLHGIGLSGDCWLRNLGPLSERYTVIAPDLLGHGFSEAADFKGVASQLANARHVAALAEALDLRSYSIVGSSYGGLVGSLVYFSHPERVTKLGIVGSASAFQSEEDQAKALHAAAALAEQALGNPTLESCRRRMEGVVFDPGTVPPELIWLQLTSYAFPDRRAAYSATIEACIANLGDRNSRVAWRLEEINVPAWVAVGRNDIRADWRAHETGVKRMRNARLSIYENCGHLSFLEHPNRFNADLTAFLLEP
jgi:2-hydroxy-6-oxonona-2,4-dienedioate hydrolase